MKASRTTLIFCSIILAFILTSCSSSDQHRWDSFQTNEPAPTFNLFSIFDGYPSINDAWKKVETYVFNEGLAALILNTPVNRLKDVIGLMSVMVEDTDQPLFKTMGVMRTILGNIVNQDSLDDDPVLQDGSAGYSQNFFSFMDSMSAANANFSENLVPIIAKLLMYINATNDTMNDRTQVTQLTNDLLYMMQEQTYDNNAAAQNLNYFLPLLQEALGKLLLRNNTDMYLDGSTHLPIYQLTASSPSKTSDHDTGLSNSVTGMESVLYGLNQLSSQAPEARTLLYDALLEMGRLTSKDANGKLFKTVLKELLANMEDYFTAQGGVYSVNTDYHIDNGTYYVNAELKNTVRELWPALELLFIRSKAATDPVDKPDYSILKDNNGRSPLEVISKSLGRLYDIGIDYNANTLEPSMREMIEKNASGTDRSSTDSSYLDRLLFTLAIASNFGYLTRLSDSGEPYTNWGRGHGFSTGGTLTLNDSMYNLRSNDFLTLNAYTLSLDKRTTQAGFIGRSSSAFTNAQIGSHKFFLGYDYPAFFLLPAGCAGDAGIPNGGESGITPISDATTVTPSGGPVSQNDYRTYFPKVGNGIGETNTAAVMMGMIARICWEGEGPYYSTAASSSGTVNGTSGTIYYRPDGRVYAVNSGGTLYYPADGSNDADANSDGWRENRYNEKLESDYYLIKPGFTSEYCPAPINERNNGTNYVKGASGNDPGEPTHSPLKFKLISSPTHNADKFVFWEKIAENSSSRQCATQEEAMYRNFQWLVNEKKFAFTIPMWIESLGMNSASFIVIEANGLAGLSNATKGYDPADPTNPVKGNGAWVKQALLPAFSGDPEGTTLIAGSELTTRRNMTVNYGDSYQPGDARVMVFCREDNAVTLDLIWQNILGKGHVLPDIIVQNFSPVPRMAFMSAGPTLASNDRTSTWDTAWSTRSTLFPLVAAAVGELHKRSYYQTSSSGYNYNFAGSHKYPIRTVLSSLIPPLVKPWMRYLANSGQPRWVPRVADETKGDLAYFSPSVVWNDTTNIWELTNVDLRPRTGIKTLVNVLTESTPGMHNGLLPLMTKQAVLSKMLAMLQRAESAGSGVTQGTRDSLFHGLELLITTIKGSKGEVVTKQEASPTDLYTTMNYSTLGWMFTRRYKAPGDYIDLSLDVLLDELIGTDDVINQNGQPASPGVWTLTTPGKGIAAFVDRREKNSVANKYYEAHLPLPDGHHWYWNDSAADRSMNFEVMMDAMRSLMSDDGPNGTSYYIMNDMVTLLDKFLSRISVTPAQISGMRHTLGVLMATYNSTGGSWQYSSDLAKIMSIYLPDIMGTFSQHYDDLMIVAYNLFQPQGLMKYLMTGMTTSYSWSQIFSDLDRLLQDPFFTDPAAPRSLWIGKNSLIEILVKMVDMIGQDWYTRLIFMGPSSGIAPYDPNLLIDGEVPEFNPYKTLGEILSIEGR